MKRTALRAFSLAIALSGCDSTDAPAEGVSIGGLTYSGSTEPLVIDSLNRAQVSAFAVAAAKGEVMTTVTAGIYKGAESAAVAEGVFSRVVGMLSDAARATGRRKGAVGVLDSWSDPCRDGGSVSYTTSYLDPSSLEYAPGDWESVRYEDCSAYGVTRDGHARATVSAADYPAAGGFSLSVDYEVSALSIAEAGRTLVVGGAFTHWQGESSDAVVGAAFTGERVVVRIEHGDPIEELLLSEFAFSLRQSADGSRRYGAACEIAARRLGGRIALETTGDLAIAAGREHPDAGQLLVRGAEEGRLRLTAQSDGTHLFIEYDAIGADYGASETQTWSALEGAANAVVAKTRGGVPRREGRGAAAAASWRLPANMAPGRGVQ